MLRGGGKGPETFRTKREARKLARDIIVVSAEEKPWQEVDVSWAGKVARGEPDVVFKELIESGAPCPRVQLIRYDPSHYEKRHSHPTGEFLYIISGSLDLGDESLAAGTLVYIDKNTVYGPIKAGSDGTEFLRVEVP
jgi:hypothetical protein